MSSQEICSIIDQFRKLRPESDSELYNRIDRTVFALESADFSSALQESLECVKYDGRFTKPTYDLYRIHVGASYRVKNSMQQSYTATKPCVAVPSVNEILSCKDKMDELHRVVYAAELEIKSKASVYSVENKLYMCLNKIETLYLEKTYILEAFRYIYERNQQTVSNELETVFQRLNQHETAVRDALAAAQVETSKAHDVIGRATSLETSRQYNIVAETDLLEALRKELCLLKYYAIKSKAQETVIDILRQKLEQQNTRILQLEKRIEQSEYLLNNQRVLDEEADRYMVYYPNKSMGYTSTVIYSVSELAGTSVINLQMPIYNAPPLDGTLTMNRHFVEATVSNSADDELCCVEVADEEQDYTIYDVKE